MVNYNVHFFASLNVHYLEFPVQEAGGYENRDH